MSEVEEKAKKERMAIRAAELSAAGVGANKAVSQLAQEFDLSFTRTRLYALHRHPAFHEFMERNKDAMIKAGINRLKVGIQPLIPEVIESLQRAIKEDNMQAIAHVLKIAGIDADAPTQQAQGITVIMPGAKQEKEVTDAKDITEGIVPVEET